MSKAQSQALEFVAQCEKHGFSYSTNNDIVIISKYFEPNDTHAYVNCDLYGPLVMESVPLRGGSVWGTDGGSVGGHSGLVKGNYVLKKSGTGKNFIKALLAHLHNKNGGNQ